MVSNEFIHRRNLILLILISVFYLTQVLFNISIEGLESVFPPAFLFILLVISLVILIYRNVHPKFIMYCIISFMYMYFYFLLVDSPYLVNYLFMWLALPLCAIYHNYKVVIIAGIASIILTFYSFFKLHHEIFPNVDQGDFVYFVLFGVFITTFLLIFINSIKKTNAKLQVLAYYDPLTGAANRLLLKETFNSLKTAKVDSMAILFIDMNGFKKVNDTYGHEVGDQLLQKFVMRLNGSLREKDLLCRLGGDEFVILSSGMEEQILEVISKRIHYVLEEPIKLEEQLIQISASVGWYYTSDVSQAELDMMIKEADTAMYSSKLGERRTEQLRNE